MKILILGAGQVGSSVAAALSIEDENDITVVDRDTTRLRELTEKLDIRAVAGHASLPSILTQAGVEEADLLVAVTSSDEVNIIACQIAAQQSKSPIRVARLREQEYLALARQGFGGEPAVSAAISPEKLVCHHIERLITTPGALQVLDFAEGRAQLIAVRALEGGALVGHEIRELRRHLPQGMDVRVAAIFRGGQAVKPDGITVIEAGDEVFFLAHQTAIKAMMSELRSADKRLTKRIFISGGGGIGIRLAKTLESRYSVKVLERSRDRAKIIAEELLNTIVLVGDCADEDLLREENIDQTDVYCALTNDDEANILSAMLAKRLGCPRVVALINRASYAELVEGSTIDIAISPQSVTLSALLSHIREGAPERVYSLRRGAAEAIEVVVRGDRRSSRVIGRELDDLELPPSTTIGGIVRGDALLIAHHDVMIEAGDHVILFVANKRDLPEVIALFKEVDWR